MKKKQIPIIILLVILVQITLQLIIPIHTIAAEEIVTIQCNDINFYNRLVEELEGQIQSKNDTEKTITMTKTNVESVTSINLGNSDDTNDSLKITDITGIENFINLTNLRLYYNNISDISVLSGLTNLTHLYLYNNNISDINALSGLTELTDLSLSNNNISEINTLSGLTNLTYLNLYNNNISDIGILSGLMNLTELSVSSNKISDIRALSGLTNLTNLILSYNNISDISALSGLTNLTDLRLHFNNISDINALSGLTELTDLSLSNNNISEINTLSGLTNLTYLNLYNNNISDIRILSGLMNLTELSVSSNKISDIRALSGLTNLDKLYLYGNEISDISALSGLTNLTELNLEDNIIQRTIAKNRIQEIELPQIIKAAKDSNSKIYTEEEYKLTNCSLSEDGTKIIVNTDEVTEASIQIQGGNADGTKFTANIIVDTTPPELEIEYSTTEPTEENVIVTIIANEEIQIPDGWIEGEDKNIIYKEYDANTEEIVVIKDLVGNETEANIKIENIIKKGNNGQNDDQTSGDETLADKEYPAAGIGKILLICIGVIIITGTIGFIKNKKYKNI